MFPDSPQAANTPSTIQAKGSAQGRLQPSSTTNEDPYVQLAKEFVGEVRSQLATLTGEIALRNKVIMTNDAYVYGDLLQRSLDVPVGHDFTPVNWLRRVCEIHRTETLGDGFQVTSGYHGKDIDEGADEDEQKQISLYNDKLKDYTEARNNLVKAVIRDNGGQALWARMIENASCIGTSVLKAWYDPDQGKYVLDMIEAVEHYYAIWSKSNFREVDLEAYVYQISKQNAVEEFHVPPTVATSPLGHPLAVLSSANTVEYISTQPMVTVMEINGRVQGWGTTNGQLHRVQVGSENKLNAVIVGDRLKKLVDDPKYLPHFYIFPNKMIRRRPWGLPDITTSAINIMQTYIETLSDWRTVESKVNFPKYKAFGFGMDTQLPKPKARTVEMIGLGEGQDIQPIQNPNSEIGSEIDFQRMLAELKEEFVRETGISPQLFDMPDAPDSNSNQAKMTAMKTISDQVAARRTLWGPILVKIFKDMLNTLSLWDDNIKELATDPSDWYLRVQWPSAMKKEDPVHQAMLINRLNTNSISIQSFLERIGENAKEEIDRIKDEMTNPITAAIHGRLMQLLAEFKIAGPPSMAPPKVNVNLRGDISPGQEGNLAYLHGFNNGPVFPTEEGPQGALGLRAIDDTENAGMISGHGSSAGEAITHPPPGQPGQPAGGSLPQATQSAIGQPLYPNSPGGPGAAPAAGGQPGQITPPTNNQPGQQPMSMPGSGQAQPTSAKGAVNKSKQRRGK